MDAVNKNLKFVILQRVYVISLLLLQILAAIEHYQYSRMRILHITFFNSCQHFIKLMFVIGPFKTFLWSHHLYFLKNKQGICACVVSNFHPWFNSHRGLAKPSWSLTRYIESKFLHVIVMSFEREVYYLVEMKFQLGLTRWNFSPG